MNAKQPFDLNSRAPMNAKSVVISYEIMPPTGRALIHKRDGDPSPLTLQGPKGQVTVEVDTSRTIYIEGLDGALTFNIRVIGYSF